jgi:hypothetical protein
MRQQGRIAIDVGGARFPAGLSDQILAAVRAIDIGGAWADVASNVVPVLKRLHHHVPDAAAPVYMYVPPGVWTGFGIDLGPAFSHVSKSMVDRWDVDEMTILSTALANLGRVVVEQPPIVQRFRHDDAEVIAIQGHGWGSSLVLLPEALAPILGGEPRILLAPVRNLLVALPEDVGDGFALDVWQAITDGAHDELDVDPLSWTGATVTTLDDRTATHVH